MLSIAPWRSSTEFPHCHDMDGSWAVGTSQSHPTISYDQYHYISDQYCLKWVDLVITSMIMMIFEI